MARNINLTPATWQPWYERICDLLKVQANKPLRQQMLKKPWFIIPIESEIQEHESDALTIAVRDYLFSNGETIRSVRSRLALLNPESSLVFLYLMRHVAFREAESHRYWPVFRERVFDGKLSYKEVALGLASTTSELWLQLYEISNGSLYFPREGSRHIKWPLAHAGLLTEDKAILREFGFELIASSIDTFHTVTESETDEFLFYLSDWLRDRDDYSKSRLGILILGSRQEKVVVGEFCQQWLRVQETQIAGRIENQAFSLTKKVIPVRRNIILKSNKHEIGLQITIGRFPGNQNINLSWNKDIYSIPTQYLHATNETIPLETIIGLSNPDWPNHAELITNRETIKLGMPIIEEGKPIVFDAITGSQTKRWEFGRDYFVLISGKNFEADKGRIVFSDWLNLNQPKGDWQDYSLLWVKTRDPLVHHTKSAGNSNFTKIIKDIEKTVDEMNLPSFGHQFRVRATLICGKNLDFSDFNFPVYSDIQPPYLELSGIWNKEISVMLSKRDELSGQFVQVSKMLIDEEQSGNQTIIELWDDSAEKGEYRISTEDNELLFFITPVSERAKDIVPTLADHISGRFQDFLGREYPLPSRYSLGELSIMAEAWPFAELSLTIRQETHFDVQKISVYVTEEGQMAIPISDLPIRFESFPPGNIIFEISWRGLFKKELIAFEKNHVSTSNLDIQLVKANREFILKVSGILVGITQTEEYSISLFAEIPWFRQEDFINIEIDNVGRFEKVINLPWEPKWIAFFHKRLNGNWILLSIHQIGSKLSTSNPSIELLAALEQIDGHWDELSKSILDLPHPPLLDKYLEVVPIVRLLNSALGLLRSGYRWKFYTNWDEWGMITYYLRNNCSLSIFKEIPPIGSRAQSTIRHVSFSTSVTSVNRNTYDLRMGEGEAVPITGKLFKQQMKTHEGIRLHSLDYFCYCPNCKLLIPSRYVTNHLAPFEEIEKCSPSEIDCSSYELGSNLNSIVIGVFSDPFQSLRAIYSNLVIVMKGEKLNSDDFVDWLPTLRLLISPTADPRASLENLIRILQLMLVTHSSRNISLDELNSVGNTVVGLEKAVQHIVERTLDTIPSL